MSDAYKRFASCVYVYVGTCALYKIHECNSDFK